MFMSASTVLISEAVFDKSSFMESGLQYYRGHCNFTQTFPKQNGVYTYFFLFVPGPSGERKQTLKIEPPGEPRIHQCPRYISEGSTLLCDCTTTKPGDPPAMLSWGAESKSYQLRLDDVRRDQNGTEYTCRQTWGKRDCQFAKYRLQVAYGPEDRDLSISGHSTFTADGTRTLTLSCQASNTNPTIQYTWTGVTCNEGDRGSTCSFTLRVPEDDGKVATCTATNTVITTKTKTAKTTYKVTLNYPPSKIIITGYNSSDLLITGDSVSLTCTVGGGKPPVTGINFYCKRKDNTRINGTFNPASSSSTVTIDALTVRDNGTGCACDTKGYWPADLNHSLESSIRLTLQGARPAVSENDSSNPFPIAAVAGAVGGAVGLLLLIVIVVVVVRVTSRRKDTGKITSDGLISADCEVLEEHVNSMYMSSDADPTSPDQLGHASKPSSTSLGLSPDSLSKNRDAPANRRLVDLSSGYTYVDVDGEPQKGAASYGGNRLGTANTRMTDFASNNADEDGYSCVEITPPNPMNHISASVHRDSSAYTDADGYSSVLECKPDVGVKKLEDRVDEYDVANRTQSWKATQGRSDVYDHITKKATGVSHEVFAEVNKSSKRNAEGTVQKMETEPDLCAHAQKPRTNPKPNPAVKPNPHQTYGAPHHTADSDNYEDVGILQMEVSQEERQDVTQEAEQDDEYNVLSHKPVSRDQDPQYSHIGDL